MAMVIYGAVEHRRAFEAWMEGRSLRSVGRIIGVNDRTIKAWLGDGHGCRCPWHHWQARRDALIAALTSSDPPADSAPLPVTPVTPSTFPLRRSAPIPSVPPGHAAPDSAPVAPARYALEDPQRAFLDQARKLWAGLERQALRYVAGQIITDQEGNQHVLPAVPPKSYGELVRALQSIYEVRQMLFGLTPPQRIEVTGAEGGPVQYADVSTSVDDRQARVRALLAVVKGREDETGSDNGDARSVA